MALTIKNLCGSLLVKGFKHVGLSIVLSMGRSGSGNWWFEANKFNNNCNTRLHLSQFICTVKETIVQAQIVPLPVTAECIKD